MSETPLGDADRVEIAQPDAEDVHADQLVGEPVDPDYEPDDAEAAQLAADDTPAPDEEA